MRLWLRNDSGRPGTKVWIQIAKPGELDGNLVDVHAIHAAAGDLRAEKGAVSIPVALQVPERLVAATVQVVQLDADLGERVLGQERGEPRLDPVDRRDEEVR